MIDTPLTPEQLEAFREELEAELLKLERSMRVTDEGLKPVELDPGAVGRLSRIDELQNQAMTRNLREREEVKLGSLTDARRRIEKGTYGILPGSRTRSLTATTCCGVTVT